MKEENLLGMAGEGKVLDRRASQAGEYVTGGSFSLSGKRRPKVFA